MKTNFAKIVRRSLMGLAVAGSLAAGVLVQRGVADDLRNDIRHDQRDIRQDQRKLRRDMWNHGSYSRQAQRDRADLRRDYWDVQNDRRVLNQRYDGRYWDGYGYGYRNGQSGNRGNWQRYRRGDGDYDRDDR